MMLATDGVRAAQGVERPQEPGGLRAGATSEEGQAYPARLALAQGRVSLRQPPLLVAAKHRLSKEETTWSALHLQEEVGGGREGWLALSEVLWNIKEGDSLLSGVKTAQESTELGREVCNTLARKREAEAHASMSSLCG